MQVLESFTLTMENELSESKSVNRQVIGATQVYGD